MDHLTKVAHFIPVSTTYNGAKHVELYMDNIIHLRGVPKIITSGRGPQFTSQFWDSVHELLGTELFFSTMFHP